MTDIAEGPLQTLMSLLNPDNQQWLKSQTPQRQQELAQQFHQDTGTGGQHVGIEMIEDTEKAPDPTALANNFITGVRGRDELARSDIKKDA
ncbi:hypothetical protein QOM21_23905 [Streptomyces sp. Pv4-95]|uniref:hypothetical protein n=1 Tax=Streptomyces sp. Pv4-95 TaxID=3049543 RepID=UPI0038915F4B